MRRLLVAAILVAAFVLGFACTSATLAPPRVEIIERVQFRLLNGDIGYLLTVGRRTPDGRWEQVTVRVSQIVFIQLRDRSEACIYAGGQLRPCP
jgi:hypothetical protein